MVGCGLKQLDGIDLLVLNSGIECYSEQSVKHGRLGDTQYQWLESKVGSILQPDTTKIAIVHHHLINLSYPKPVPDLSAMEEGPNVADKLADLGFNMVLHGHRHHPFLFTDNRSYWTKPLTFFCAGSFGVNASHRSSGRIPNTMHTLEFDTYSGSHNFHGVITSYEQESSGSWHKLRGNNREFRLNPDHWFGNDGKLDPEPEVKNEISKAVSKLTSGNFQSLSDYDDLPLILRCMHHEDLNQMFSEVAQSFGVSITGDYPKGCIVTEDG